MKYFLDESLFNGQYYQKIGWSRPRENIIVNQIGRHNNSITAVGAISQNQSKILTSFKKGYINKIDMIEFLRFLKRYNCGKKIELFLDIYSAHKFKEVKDYCEKAKIPVTYNISYCP